MSFLDIFSVGNYVHILKGMLRLVIGCFDFKLGFNEFSGAWRMFILVTFGLKASV